MRDTEKAVLETEELPRTVVRHVVKDKLSRCSKDGYISVHKMLSLLSPKEHGSSFTTFWQWKQANDMCKESKRQILNADDIFKALRKN